MNEILTPSCRVAFAALIHDIGKFAERAKIEIAPAIKEGNVATFCPYDKEHAHHTHIHAAYTGIAIDAIEKYLPAINNADTFPFQTDKKDNSIITAAAMHHIPNTYLQHIISTADRLSSAFERTQYEEYNQTIEGENYITARLIPLFEKLLKENTVDFAYRYPLQALSSESVFPILKQEIGKDDAVKEYHELWSDFLYDIRKISNRDNWSLWLDAFDTLYSVYTQNIPSSSYKTLADVSLYDHSKSTAAMATALWRYHYETETETENDIKDDTKAKFLLIQGDVSGIQKFIFEAGKNTRKNAYKILRGRSFMVSLFSECAALKILEALELPSTSQIMNAAGKFVILAPNTDKVKSRLNEVKADINNWFGKNYYGLVSVGIATLEASQKDFENKNFAELQRKIFRSLGTAKMQKFDLCRHQITFDDFFEQYEDNKGLCCYDGRMPATEPVPNSNGEYACARCLDILSIGEKLTGKNLLSLTHEASDGETKTDILGFYIGWQKADSSVRLWDISLPDKATGSVFNGYARRYINAYIPRFDAQDTMRDIYKGLDSPIVGMPKTFSHLALEDCIHKDDKLLVKPGLMCIKGDIDNLGHILGNGLKSTTFATMAGLSRQINNFFAIWLPQLCQSDEKARNIYTVFAGGDDFYLIGPWLDMVEILPRLREKFNDYVCRNDRITFSAGMCMTKSGDDVLNMSSMAEDALENAKKRKGNDNQVVKNAVSCYGRVVSYDVYRELLALEADLDALYSKYNLSTVYIYDLLTLCEDADLTDKGKFIHAMWRSKLYYRTARFAETLKDELGDKKEIADLITKKIGSAIETYKADYKIALSIWLYKHREEKYGSIIE